MEATLKDGTKEFKDKTLSALELARSWNVKPSQEVKESFSIITSEAVANLATFHSRMPMFLLRDSWDLWLESSNQDVAKARSLFDIFQPDANLNFWPVSNLVDSIANDGLMAIKPMGLTPETIL